MNEYHKICAHCDEEFEATHLNQNYCCSTCRIRHNNGKARRARNRTKNITENINNILLHNRDVLADLREETISLAVLETKGFRLNYITRFELVNKTNIFYCYDMKYEFYDASTIHIH